MNAATNSYRWEQGFPIVYWHTSLSFLKKCPGFYSAKCGDLQAARNIVSKCIKSQCIEELRQKYPDAVLLPVMTNNKLPLALAQAIGLELCSGAVLRRDKRSAQMYIPGWYLCQLEFLPLAARRYILVDDIITPNGAIYTLQKHVLNCGGKVEAVVALAHSPGDETEMHAPAWEWGTSCISTARAG